MKILFITATRIGDAVLSTGLLEHIRKEYPQAQVTVACGWLAASLFEGFPNVETVISVRKEKLHGHWFKLWADVIGTQWDMVIDLRNSAVSRLIRAQQSYIFGKHIDKSKHKVEQAASVMELNSIAAPKLYFTDMQRIFADQIVKDRGPVIGIGPSANWIGKTWPQENFIELLEWIRGSEGFFPDAFVAVFAAPGEEDQARPVLESVPKDRQIDVIAKGNPAEAAAVIARCDLYVGNDSGLMHCAAAAGVPTFGLFGPSYPHLYAPWGEHTDYISTHETYDELTNFDGYDPKTLHRSLMTSLDVESVQKSLLEFWSRGLRHTAT